MAEFKALRKLADYWEFEASAGDPIMPRGGGRFHFEDAKSLGSEINELLRRLDTIEQRLTNLEEAK